MYRFTNLKLTKKKQYMHNTLMQIFIQQYDLQSSENISIKKINELIIEFTEKTKFLIVLHQNISDNIFWSLQRINFL